MLQISELGAKPRSPNRAPPASPAFSQFVFVDSVSQIAGELRKRCATRVRVQHRDVMLDETRRNTLTTRPMSAMAMLRQLSGRPIALNSRRWLARTTRIGVDFHPEFQQIAAVDTDTGEVQEKRLAHREDAEAFSLHLL